MNETRRGIRWWPAVVVAVLATVALAWVWLSEAPSRQNRVMDSMMVVALTVLLLLLWWIALSRVSWKLRLLGLVAVVGLGYLLSFLVEVRGVTGDVVPILGWRWDKASTATGEASARIAASDYPQFQGPARNGTVPALALARDWEAQPPKLLWRRPVGAGWAGFAVVGDAAYTLEQNDESELVVSYDLSTGEQRWATVVAERFESGIGGNGPRSTPTVLDGRVYSFGATGRLTCLDAADGHEIWSRDVMAEAGAESPEWGKSCSPLVTGEQVVVSAGGAGGQSLVAYHRDTGDRLWSGGGDASGYSSPLEAELAGHRQILIFNQASVAGHDPTDGRVLWSMPWSDEQPNVAQPVVLGEDRVLVSSGYGIGSALFEVRDTDGELSARELWKTPRLKLKFSQAVVHGGYLYGLDDGVMVCLDPATGERCWKGGRYGHGQILLTGDLLVVLSERGKVLLLEPNPEELRELTSFQALDGKTWNPPTLAGNFLLVRHDREAACYELPLAT